MESSQKSLRYRFRELPSGWARMPPHARRLAHLKLHWDRSPCALDPSGSGSLYLIIWASQVALVVKNPPANAGDIRDVGSIPRWGSPPGGEPATQSNILPGESLGFEKPGRLQSIGSRRVRHDWSDLEHVQRTLCLIFIIYHPPPTWIEVPWG